MRHETALKTVSQCGARKAQTGVYTPAFWTGCPYVAEPHPIEAVAKSRVFLTYPDDGRERRATRFRLVSHSPETFSTGAARLTHRCRCCIVCLFLFQIPTRTAIVESRKRQTRQHRHRSLSNPRIIAGSRKQESARQPPPPSRMAVEESPGSISRAPGNAWRTRVHGKCHRKYTAQAPLGAGKGEKVW